MDHQHDAAPVLGLEYLSMNSDKAVLSIYLDPSLKTT